MSGPKERATSRQSPHRPAPYIDSAPLNTPATQWQIFHLAGSGPDVLHLRPYKKGRAVALVGGAVALYVGGLLCWLSYAARDLGSKDGRWFFVAVGVMTLLVAGLPVYLGLSNRVSGDVVFDRRAGTARGRVWAGGRWHGAVAFPLGDVTCLQLCSRDIEHPEERGYHTYELNLVLSDPPGRRLGLGSHAEKKVVDADAARLAAFLGCGVLDDCARAARYRDDAYDPRQVNPFNVADR